MCSGVRTPTHLIMTLLLHWTMDLVFFHAVRENSGMEAGALFVLSEPMEMAHKRIARRVLQGPIRM